MERFHGLTLGHHSDPVPTGKGGKGIASIWLFSESAIFTANKMVDNDLKPAQLQFDTFVGQVENFMNTAISSGTIPLKYQSSQMLGDIANYIFQGEFINTYDNQTFQDIKEISQSLIISNEIPLNCDRCQQEQ